MALRKYFFLTGILCCSLIATAQQRLKQPAPGKAKQQARPVKKAGHKPHGTGVVAAPPPPPEVFTYVEQLPEFPGGRAALDRYLADHIRYPAIAREEGTEGTVVVRFIVDSNGIVTKAEAMRDIGSGCGREVLRVIAGMPRWQPYKLNGRRLPCVFSLRTKFSLDHR